MLDDMPFPHATCPNSRHAASIAMDMRTNPLRRLLINAGHDPDHMADSIEGTVRSLWQARSEQ